MACSLIKASLFAVSEAEEQHIDLIERHLGSELQVTIPVESFVHVGDQVAGITFAVDENNLGIRMIHEQANEFACRVSRATQNTYSDVRCG